MVLSVVVVNWSSCAHLRGCLRSLAEQSYRPLEVIVVDNGSTDDSVAMVRDEFPEVTLLAQGENLGFAQGCNQGIAASQGSWVCMLNNDVVADPDWAAALVRAIERAPATCGMVQSLMVYASRPEVVNTTGVAPSLTGSGRDRSEGQPRSACAVGEEIFCVSAGACAYRRRMLDELQVEGDWFDGRHFMYYEDMDLGWRARLAGWSAWYVPDSVVLHLWHGSSCRRSKAWLRCLAETNRVRTTIKNGSWQLLLRCAPIGLRIAGELLWLGGPTSLADLTRAAREAWRSRAAVESLRRRDRREVERRWFRRSAGQAPRP